MFLPHVTKLLPLISLVVTVTAAPAPAVAIVDAAVRDCESDYAHCLRLRMSLDYCQETVCNSYNNECKPCQDNALPKIYDRAVTHPTSDETITEVQVLSSRADADAPRSYCIAICTHAHCALLCTNPSHPFSAAVDEIEVAADTNTTDLLDLTNAQPDQLGILLEDGATTMITNMDADGKLEGNCTWLCSGKVTCRLVCCDSAATEAQSEAQCSLIEDGGALPEGNAIEGAGKCEIVKKNKVAEIMVCQLPESAAGNALTAGVWNFAGVHCVIYWIGLMPQLVCRNAD